MNASANIYWCRENIFCFKKNDSCIGTVKSDKIFEFYLNMSRIERNVARRFPARSSRLPIWHLRTRLTLQHSAFLGTHTYVCTLSWCSITGSCLGQYLSAKTVVLQRSIFSSMCHRLLCSECQSDSPPHIHWYTTQDWPSSPFFTLWRFCFRN